MWRYGLLGAPIFGLVLFYTLSFELALLVYLPGVCLAFWLYDRLAERAAAAQESAHWPRWRRLQTGKHWRDAAQPQSE